jgi:hypothetical protein
MPTPLPPSKVRAGSAVPEIGAPPRHRFAVLERNVDPATVHVNDKSAVTDPTPALALPAIFWPASDRSRRRTNRTIYCTGTL